jgi:integrase
MGSVFSVSSLVRLRSGAWRSRKAIPASVRAEYQRLYGGPQARSGKAWEAIFGEPASTPLHRAKALHADWLSLVERRIAALKGARASEGATAELSQRDADALAGQWYQWFTSQYVDNAGHASHWSELKGLALELLDLDEDHAAGGIAIEGRVERFLTDRGVTLSKGSMALFLDRVSSQFIAAASTLERRARGDWSVDQHMAQLAPYHRPQAGNGSRQADACGATSGQTAVSLFDAYCKAKKLKPSTIRRQKYVFPALDAAGWQGLDWDAQKWADDLIGPGRAASGVRRNWIAAPRAVWKWAQRKRLVSSNPFIGVTVEVPRKVETRETRRAFTEEEAATILRHALAYPTIPRTSGRINFPEAARRWVPWLCAYTGARVGELTQLRVQDIEHRACGHVLCITPEAGPVKTDTARWVPIHLHLVEMGLLAHVEAVRAGGTVFLFHSGHDTGKGRGPAVYTSERLAKWVRSLSARCPSLADKGVQPNHGWRHTFRTRAARAGIEKRLRDEICGHAPGTVGDGYEHPTVEDMAIAMRLFPSWNIGSA